MICMEITGTGERRKIENEVWITTNRNGIIITPHRIHAKGVGDGESIWSLGELEGCPLARIITLAEYEESLTAPETDPELTDAQALDIILGGNHEAE